MRSTTILELSQQMMAQYEKMLPAFKQSLERKLMSGSDLNIKDDLHDFLWMSVLSPVLDCNADKLLKDQPQHADKMQLLVDQAFEFAYAQQGAPVNLETNVINVYLNGFKSGFEAACLIEMYRAFMAHGQVGTSLKQEVIRRFPDLSGAITAERISCILQELFDASIRDELKKFEAKLNLKKMSQEDRSTLDHLKLDVVNIISDLNKSATDYLQSNAGKSSVMMHKMQALQNISLEYQIKACKLIKRYEVKPQSNKSWAPLLKNLLIALTGVGAILTVISLGVKAARGQYLFFDRPVIRDAKPESLLFETKLQAAGEKYLYNNHQ